MFHGLWSPAKALMGFQLTLKISEDGNGICKGARIHSQAIMTTVNWKGFELNLKPIIYRL